MAVTLPPIVLPTKQNVDLGSLLTLVSQGAGTFNSNIQMNDNCCGINLVIDITLATTATLQVTIQGYDSASGKFYTVLQSASLAAVATTVLTAFPGSTVTANLSANNMLPARWRVQAVVTGTVSATIGAAVMGEG
jgi:hypothetical protein